MNATVRDVMSTRVVAVHRDATYKEMVTQLRERRISAFPVLDDDYRVIGVVSEADLLAKEALQYSAPGLGGKRWHGRALAKAAGLTAADLMSTPPVTIGPREPVARAARVMYSRRVKRLPVVNAEGRLIGIVSRADVLGVYTRPDAAIRDEVVEDVILGTLLTDPARFAVTVSSGVVTVEGEPESASVGRAMIEEIRHVEGVVAVRDRLTYPPEARSVPLADADLRF